MNKMKIICAFLLILTISACSSGGGGGGSKSDSGSDTASDGGGGSSGGGGGSSSGGSGGGSSGGGSGGGGSSSSDDAGGSVATYTLPTVLSGALGIDSGPIGGMGASATEVKSTLTALETAYDALKTEISKTDSSLATPTLPTGGEATLKGYVRFAGRVDDDEGLTDIAGNLQIVANFGSKTVTTTATDLAEFSRDDEEQPSAMLSGDGYIDPNGAGNMLSGTGTITGSFGTTIRAGLEGDLPIQVATGEDPATFNVNLNLGGAFYDNGDGLIAYGTTVNRNAAGEPIDGGQGEFAASGDIE